MGREDIKIKFRHLVKSALGQATDEVFDLAWSIVDSDDCSKVFQKLVTE
jgi:2-methylcitrate dehydratase